jgi:hypothetical protein
LTVLIGSGAVRIVDAAIFVQTRLGISNRFFARHLRFAGSNLGTVRVSLATTDEAASEAHWVDAGRKRSSVPVADEDVPVADEIPVTDEISVTVPDRIAVAVTIARGRGSRPPTSSGQRSSKRSEYRPTQPVSV